MKTMRILSYLFAFLAGSALQRHDYVNVGGGLLAILVCLLYIHTPDAPERDRPRSR